MEDLVTRAETPKQKEFIRQLADEDGADALEISERGGTIILNEVNTEKIQKELIAYQDGPQTGELASSGLRNGNVDEPRLDSVEVVKTGEVFDGVN